MKKLNMNENKWNYKWGSWEAQKVIYLNNTKK